MWFPPGDSWGRGESDPPRGFLQHSLIILLTRLRDKQASAEKTALCYLITHREQRFAYSKRTGKKTQTQGKCLPLNITEAFDGSRQPWPVSLPGVLPSIWDEWDSQFSLLKGTALGRAFQLN